MTGVIYKTQNYRETSRMLFVYSITGKKTLVARGVLTAKSNIRAYCQYLTAIEYEDNEKKSMFNVSNIKLVNEYANLKQLEVIKYVAVALEVIDRAITDDNDHEKIYNELMTTLDSKDIKKGVISFLIRLLYFLGYGPNLDGDGRKIKGLSISEGGVIYENENKNIDLSFKDTIMFLKLKHRQADDEIFPAMYLRILDYIKKYYLYHLEIELFGTRYWVF